MVKKAVSWRNLPGIGITPLDVGLANSLSRRQSGPASVARARRVVPAPRLGCIQAGERRSAGSNPGHDGKVKTRRSIIRKSGNRFSEKIMLKQEDEIMIRFNLIGS